MSQTNKAGQKWGRRRTDTERVEQLQEHEPTCRAHGGCHHCRRERMMRQQRQQAREKLELTD